MPESTEPTGSEEENPARKSSSFRQQLEAIHQEHGSSFAEFTNDALNLVELGRELMSADQATGINILKSRESVPLDSDRPLIFYSRYIHETDHLSQVLETMVAQEIITADQISLGAKASIVINGGWDPDPTSQSLTLSRPDGTTITCDQTVETVIIFAPNSPEQAQQIANFLYDETPKLPHGWETPDIRATSRLENLLDKSKFSPIKVNILTNPNDSALIVARKVTSFDEPWKSHPALMNAELAEFISSQRVSP